MATKSFSHILRDLVSTNSIPVGIIASIVKLEYVVHMPSIILSLHVLVGDCKCSSIINHKFKLLPYLDVEAYFVDLAFKLSVAHTVGEETRFIAEYFLAPGPQLRAFREFTKDLNLID